MHFVFFGTPKFSVIVLQELLNAKLIPNLVVTSPDKPVGRKQIMTPSPVKEFAIKNKLSVVTIEQLNNRTIFDFGILVAYGLILPSQILHLFKRGVLNIHPSLLPKYRGPTPLQTAILNGDAESGVTIIKMDEGVDTGDIVAQEKLTIDSNDTTESLGEKLFALGAKKLVEILPYYLSNKIALKPQVGDRSDASMHRNITTKKFTKQDGYVEFSDLQKATSGDRNLSIQIDRKFRAFFPWPGIWTIDPADKRILITKCHLEKGVLKINLVKKEGNREEKFKNDVNLL